MQKILLSIIFWLLMITLVLGNLYSSFNPYRTDLVYAKANNPGRDNHGRDNPGGNNHGGNNHGGGGSHPVPVPEPSTLLLLGAGLAGVGLLRKKFKN